MRKLGLAFSYTGTLALLVVLGLNFDAEGTQWKENMLTRLQGEQVCGDIKNKYQYSLHS